MPHVSVREHEQNGKMSRAWAGHADGLVGSSRRVRKELPLLFP